MSWQQRVDDALTARRATDHVAPPLCGVAGRRTLAGSERRLQRSDFRRVARNYSRGNERRVVGSGGSGHISSSVAHRALEEELAQWLQDIRARYCLSLALRRIRRSLPP